MLKIDRTKLDRRLQLMAMTYAELCEKSGLQASTVSKVANGHRVPRASTLRKITAVLCCTPADILEDEKEAAK